MNQKLKTRKIDLHVGPDLECWCTDRSTENIVEPIVINKEDKEQGEGVEFRLKNSEYRFVGFMSPQDKTHDCFDVTKINDDRDNYSVMTIKDNFCGPVKVFDYELVYRKRRKHVGDLYRYDPQIKNVP